MCILYLLPVHAWDMYVVTALLLPPPDVAFETGQTLHWRHGALHAWWRALVPTSHTSLPLTTLPTLTCLLSLHLWDW